ncbi:MULTISPECIES: hypothetical protein [unclassified Pseudoalteromonas]|uniref:hypothetical protein n=1 Tax=unclassified Pseudoalteromonas TaxID=194690 RepID=UPI00110B60D2|nr:hypothetical protein [Pseudoalteromonas sp. S1688]
MGRTVYVGNMSKIVAINTCFRVIQSICIILVLNACGSLQRNNCGISNELYSSVSRYHRGPVNGGYDENHDGTIDHIEAFSSWDFSQLERVLHSGIEQKEYFWVNIDTCYQFHVVASDFYENKTMPVLYQTCRDFSYSVYSPNKELIGNDTGTGCRHFTNQKWEIM